MSNIHKDIEDINLHVCKGHQGASVGSHVVKSETGEQVWDSRSELNAAISQANPNAAPPTEVNGDIYVLAQTGVTLNVDAIAWQSGTTVRYTMIGDFTMLESTSTTDYIYITGATNQKHNGSFVITSIDAIAGYVQVTNALVTSAADNEASSPAVATTTKSNWDGCKTNDWVRFNGTRWYGINAFEGLKYYDKNLNALVVFNGTVWTTSTVVVTGSDIDFDDSAALNDPLLSTDVDAALKELRGRVYDRATKTYVDNLVAGLKWKKSVVVATTAAGALATDFENGDTVDGVVLATNDRILIKDQASAIENGIYIVAASGAPTRATDADTGSELVSASVLVEKGTVNADKGFVCTNDSITIGVDNITFIAFANIVQSATETSAGVAEIATQSETDTGTDDARIVTPLKLATWWTAIKAAAATISGIWTFTTEKIRIKVDGASWYHALKSLASANRIVTLPDRDITVAADSQFTMVCRSTTISPGDGEVHYAGFFNSSTNATRYIYSVPKTGRIFRIDLYVYNGGTLGTSEAVTVSFRLNNATDTLISNAVTTNALASVFSNKSLDIAVTEDDTFNIKWEFPTYATNPTGITVNAVIYMK